MPQANGKDQGLRRRVVFRPPRLTCVMGGTALLTVSTDAVRWLSRQGHLGSFSTEGQVSRLLLACHPDDRISQGNLTCRKWQLADLPPRYCTADRNAFYREAARVSGSRRTQSWGRAKTATGSSKDVSFPPAQPQRAG